MRERKPIRGSLVWWLRFLGMAAFAVVILRLPKSQEAEFSHIDLRWLGLCMLLTICQLLLETFVWQWLLSMQHIRHPYRKTLIAYLASHYLGLVTPGHVGEFLSAGYVSSETGITAGYALSSVVMKKILAWATIVSFGIWGLPLIGELPLVQKIPLAERIQRLACGGILALIVLSGGIVLWVLSIKKLARKWEKLSPWQVETTEFWAGVRDLCSLKLVIPFAVASLAFSLLFLQLDAILHALGIAIPFVLVARMVALSRVLARMFPFSIFGFGSKDAALILLLSQHGLDPAVGLTVTLLFLVCSYLVTLLLSGLCWWIKPLVIRRAARSSS